MDIVCFGQQNWDYCWTGKQQLLTRLARRGHRVLYVDPTWLGTGPPGERVPGTGGASAGLRREGPGDLHVLTHRYEPWLRWRGNLRLWPRRIRRALRELGFEPPVALALRPAARRLIDGIDTRGRVYYAVDELSAFGDRTAEERRAVRIEEEAMLRSADLALAVSPRLHARFRACHPRSRLLPNGADLAHFSPESLAGAAPHPQLRGLDLAPTAVFVGQVDERLDPGLLLGLIRRLPAVRIVLAGRVKPGVDVSALENRPEIRLLGYVPYDELPSVLREADVCLLPYRLDDLTRSCNPLKVFEYLATSIPVVATPLDSLEWCDDVVTLASGPDAFAAAVRDALARPEAGREERLARASANGWEARVAELEAILEEARAIHDRRVASRAGPADPRFAGDRMGAAGIVAKAVTDATGRLALLVRTLRRITDSGGGRPRRVLVSRRARLGDLVALLPALDALRAHHPDARIDLAVQPGAVTMARALLRGRDVVDDVLAIDFLSRRRIADRLRGAIALAWRGYDLLLTGADYSMLREAFFCGARHTAGIDDGHPLQRHLRSRVPLDPFRHEADSQLLVVETTGALAVGPARAPRLACSPGPDISAARETVGLPARASFVVVHPGAQKPSRRWPAERFGVLVRDILRSRPELRVVVTGTGDERDTVDAVVAALPAGGEERGRCLPAAAATDLPGMIALLSGADLVVCGDTGILHLARALGRPLLALLGPENEDRWGPHPGGEGPAVSLRNSVPCAPCKRWECEPHYCLRSLGVDDALGAAIDLLEGRSPPPAAYPVWADGHGKKPPRTEGVPTGLYGCDRRTTNWEWPSLAAAGHDVPRVRAVLRDRHTSAEVARLLSWPPTRILAGVGEEPGGGGVVDTEAEILAFVPDPARWTNGRLGAEVGALVRRPDLAFSGRYGLDRISGSPPPPGTAREGLTLRASALRALNRSAETGVAEDELERAIDALESLPEDLRPDFHRPSG